MHIYYIYTYIDVYRRERLLGGGDVQLHTYSYTELYGTNKSALKTLYGAIRKSSPTPPPSTGNTFWQHV